MKKNMAIAMLFTSCAVNAGGMGPTATAPSLHSFISVEGGYTWNGFNGARLAFPGVGTLFTHQNNEGGTGRVAVGLLNPVSESVFISGELGGGYYGSTTFTLRTDIPATSADASIAALASGVRVNSKLAGFDILVGAVYNQPAYDLFFKAGALLQTNYQTININTNGSDDFFGDLHVKTNQTEALPEIKLGGAYHVYENLSITASWIHAFGSTPEFRASFTESDTTPITNLKIDTRNPTLDVALLGLEYRFG